MVLIASIYNTHRHPNSPLTWSYCEVGGWIYISYPKMEVVFVITTQNWLCGQWSESFEGVQRSLVTIFVSTKWPTCISHSFYPNDWHPTKFPLDCLKGWFQKFPHFVSLPPSAGRCALGEDGFGRKLPHGARHWNWMFLRATEPHLWSFCGWGLWRKKNEE